MTTIQKAGAEIAQAPKAWMTNIPLAAVNGVPLAFNDSKLITVLWAVRRISNVTARKVRYNTSACGVMLGKRGKGCVIV